MKRFEKPMSSNVLPLKLFTLCLGLLQWLLGHKTVQICWWQNCQRKKSMESQFLWHTAQNKIWKCLTL